MSKTVLYPSSDNGGHPNSLSFNLGWYDESNNPYLSGIYISVDEGVSTANDVDFIYQQDSRNSSRIDFNTGQLLVEPASGNVTLNIRTQFDTLNPSSRQYFINTDFRDKNFTLIAEATHPNAVFVSGSYTDYSVDMEVDEFNRENWDLTDTSLVLRFFEQDSNTIQNARFSAVEVEVSGTDIVQSGIPLFTLSQPTGVSGAVTLFTEGHNVVVSGLDLYLAGNASEIDLYALGHETFNSGVSLFAEGSISENSGISLVMPETTFDFNNNINLYIRQGWRAEEGFVPESGNIPFFIYSLGTNSGLRDFTPLYLEAKNFPNNVALYTVGPDKLAFSGDTTLFTKGEFESVSNKIPFYLFNASEVSGVPLFTKAPGTNAGWNPFNTSTTLFINRPDISIAMPMFLSNKTESSGINMIVDGVNVFNSGIPMVLVNSLDTPNNNLEAFTHGK